MLSASPRASQYRTAMKITIFSGDICDVDAEAICTSTNPRLSLAMGTGGSVRHRGGHQILRQCERIVAAEYRRSGFRMLSPGSAHVTRSGDLPARIIVHCVASDSAHKSSEVIIRRCVGNALARADESSCSTVAMPLFGAGHAGFEFSRALTAIAETLRDTSTNVSHVYIVVYDPERAEEARRQVQGVIPDAEIGAQRGPDRNAESAGPLTSGWH